MNRAQGDVYFNGVGIIAPQLSAFLLIGHQVQMLNVHQQCVSFFATKGRPRSQIEFVL